jgi:organic hydroperoxide reductase OsmC/OhrA
MSREHHYRLALTWTGSGVAATTSYAAYSREFLVEVEGKSPLRGSADPLFRGDPTLHNPEEMLIAALSGCHMLSFLALAARSGLAVVAYADSSEGTMVFEGGGGRFTRVTLHPRVTLAPGGDPSLVHALHEQAHAACFIANSVNFPVEVDGLVDESSS